MKKQIVVLEKSKLSRREPNFCPTYCKSFCGLMFDRPDSDR